MTILELARGAVSRAQAQWYLPAMNILREAGGDEPLTLDEFIDEIAEGTGRKLDKLYDDLLVEKGESDDCSPHCRSSEEEYGRSKTSD